MFEFAETIRDERWSLTILTCTIALLGLVWDLSRGNHRAWRETIANIVIFLGNQGLRQLFLMHFKIALFFAVPSLLPRLPHTPIVFLLTFLAVDLSFYFVHRLEHSWWPLWAEHSVHHSSHELNYSTGLRQPWLNPFQGWPLIPLVLLGIPPLFILIAMPLNQFYQFWVHSATFPKLGWPETVFMTPSNHRVHHAQNTCYRHKNFGGVFIIWDKLFQTYQSEQDDEPPVYVGKDNINTSNPFLIQFLPLKKLWQRIKEVP